MRDALGRTGPALGPDRGWPPAGGGPGRARPWAGRRVDGSAPAPVGGRDEERAAAGLLARIAAGTADHPERAAHVWPGGSLTYRRLVDRADALADRLAGRSPAPVLVCGGKEGAMLVAMLACARAGRAYVPADAALPPHRVAWMAEAAGVRDCVAARPIAPALAGRLSERGVWVVGLDADGRGAGGAAAGAAAPPPGGGGTGTPAIAGAAPAGTVGHGAPVPAEAAGGRGTAYVMFTSGSTGRPKGVPIPWTALRHFTSWLLAEQEPVWGGEVVLNQAPFSFDLSVMDTHLALLSAGTLFSVTGDQVAAPARLFAALADSGLTTWVSTPSFARFCLAEPTFRQAMLPRLRRLLFCGEPLAPAVAAELHARFPEARIWNTYGPTETTVAVTSVRVDAAVGDAALPVGRPAPGMRVWVAGPDLAPLPDGERGEIVVAGPQVSPGYLAGDGGAAPRFVRLPEALGGGPAYRTGDLGWIGGGLLYCEGRIDRQVKLHGYRLEPEEIEACLRALPGVSDAVVLAVVRRGVPDHLTAFVVRSGPAQAGAAGGGRAERLEAEPAAAGGTDHTAAGLSADGERRGTAPVGRPDSEAGDRGPCGWAEPPGGSDGASVSSAGRGSGEVAAARAARGGGGAGAPETETAASARAGAPPQPPGGPAEAAAAGAPERRGTGVEADAAEGPDAAAGLPTAPGGGSDFAEAQALRRAVAARLPAYAVPRVIRFLAALPMTPNGKVDHRALEDLPG